MDFIQNAFNITTINGAMSTVVSLSGYEAGNIANYMF